MSGNFLESKMSETERENAANYRKPPIHTRFKKGQSGKPRGRPRKSEALLAAVLNEKVTVTENGKRRQVTKRAAVIARRINKSASAELRATKMLIDMQGDRRGLPIGWFAKALAAQPRKLSAGDQQPDVV